MKNQSIAPRPGRDNPALDAAMSEALGLEIAAWDIEFVGHFLDRVFEAVVDTRGVVRFVLSSGSPYIGVVFGDGVPRVIASWGSCGAEVSLLNLDEQPLDDLLAMVWRTTMKAALDDPPRII